MNHLPEHDVAESKAAAGNPQDRAAAAVVHELGALRKDWWWLMLLGVVLAVLGSVAVGVAFFVSVATVIFFGILLMIGGVGQIVSAFWAGRWSGFMLHLLIGIEMLLNGLRWIMLALEIRRLPEVGVDGTPE